MPRQSRLSVNDKDNIELKPGAEQRSPGIHLTAEENSETSARRPSDDCEASHRLKWSSLPSNDDGRIVQEGNKVMIHSGIRSAVLSYCFPFIFSFVYERK